MINAVHTTFICLRTLWIVLWDFSHWIMNLIPTIVLIRVANENWSSESHRATDAKSCSFWCFTISTSSSIQMCIVDAQYKLAFEILAKINLYRNG